jgi:CheY-like chemotaxis protein
MDMQMPVMDGLAATRAIRQYEAGCADRPRTPIVMLSANAMSQHRQDALVADADLHLAKPVTPAALVSGLGEALDMQAARGTPPHRRAADSLIGPGGPPHAIAASGRGSGRP